MSMFAETFGQLRKTSGLSLRELSAAVGISHNNLSCYENGTVAPTLEMVVKLARHFDVSVDYFVFGDSVSAEIRDTELRSLMQRVDEMQRTDRDLVKRYLKTVIRNREEREELERKSQLG
jgi:transcriptional regulator with XRE-family HTH domain